MTISLQYDQLNRLFPFFLLINPQAEITDCGASMQKLVGLSKNCRFFSTFSISRPFIKNNSFSDLQSIAKQVVILHCASKNIKIKGEFEYLPEQQALLFIGSPWFNSMDEVVEQNLKVADFAHHDNLIDLLHILKEYESTNIEIRQLLKKVNEQSTELKKLSLIAEETINGIIITNKEGKIEWVNKAFEHLTGYQLKEVKGKTPGSFLQGPDTSEETTAYLRHQINNGLSFNCEIVNYSKDQKKYWIRISGQPIYDQNAEVTHFFAMQEDITEKMETLHKLEQQRKFYETVLNEIPADIAVFSNKHEYLFVNPVAIKDAELRQWIIGKRDEDFCILRNKPLSVAANRRKLFNDVAASRVQKEWEEKIVTPTGEVQYLLRKMYPVYDAQNQLSIMIGYGINITERKKIEEQIKRSEKRFKDLFNFSQALICTHDLTGKVLDVNPAICETLGYTESELIGQNIQYLIPKDRQPYFYTDYLNQVIEKGKYKGVFSVYNKAGEKIFLLYQNYKVEEPGEEPYIIGFSQDITERIRAEHELSIAKQQAEEAGKSKQLFLANMSHEIRTPMTGILGLAELMKKTPQSQQQKEYTNLIIESTNTLLHIINDVLDIAKIESGKFDFEEIPFNIVHKVNNVTKAFSFKAEEKGLVLQFINEVDSSLVVAGDPHRLIQILNNLINNALKFTTQGSVTVILQQSEHNSNTTSFQFKIIDTGIGISKENQAKIFDAFVQATADTTRKFGGTGLGLAICRQLIEQQGGNIEVQSTPGVGTTFTFSITYKNTGQQALSSSQASASFSALEAAAISKHAGKKILLAEDVKLNQMIAKSILESWKHEIDIANNGLEALEMASRKQYDLILMDVHMPEMDGITATQKIRSLAQPPFNIVPIVALTASAFKSDTKRFLDAGMNTYITKPYTQQKLLECITGIFENYSTDNQLIEEDVIVMDENKSINTNHQHLLVNQNNNLPLAYNIDDIKALDDDPAFIKEMVQVFIEQVREDIAALESAVQQTNWDNIYKVAHKLKPSISSFNMYNCLPIVLDIEAMAKEKTSKEAIDVLFENLTKELEAIVQHMQNTYL